MAADPLAAAKTSGRWLNVAQRYIDHGRPDMALQACREAEKAAPPTVRSRVLGGQAQLGTGRVRDAVLSFAAALKVQPGCVPALIGLGKALARCGRSDEAAEYLRLATQLGPDVAGGWVERGALALKARDAAEALACFERATALMPASRQALGGLAAAAQQLGQLGRAREAYAGAIAHGARDATTLGNYGTLLTEAGCATEARPMLARAVRARPGDAAAISNRLYGALYDTEARPAGLVALHRRLGRRIAPAARLQAPVRDRDPSRPLRIGYVSGDFRRHPIGFFLADVLHRHDRAGVEVHCFSDVTAADWLTDTLRSGSDHWHDIAGLDHAAAAAAIAETGIDVAVDLTGHMRGNRLPAFASRMAPVQVSWAGYPATTGLPAMDAVLLDKFVAGERAQAHYTERAMADLPLYACYAPPDYAPAPAAGIGGAGGEIRFGCFGNLSKINRGTVAAWAAVLARVPDASLLLKGHGLDDPWVKDRLSGWFAEDGVAASRLHFEGPSAHDVLLRRYRDIDIMLDTMPYTGSTTMMEALWMGVPAVSLAGVLYHQRHGGAVLDAAGLGDLVADSTQAYVDTAVALATDTDRLLAVRDGLRDRVAASPICDGGAMAAALERSYRRLIRHQFQDSTSVTSRARK